MQTSLSKNTRDNTQSDQLSFSDLICSIALASLLALSVGLWSNEVSNWGADASGVLFMIMAIAYRGSNRVWWLLWAPLCMVLLFAPIAHWESSGLLSLGEAMRAALIPGLGFVGGNLLASVRGNLQLSLDSASDVHALEIRLRDNTHSLRKLRNELLAINDAITGVKATALNQSTIAETEIAYTGARISPHIFMGGGFESEAMSHIEIHSVIAGEISKLAKRLQSSGMPVQIQLRSSADSPVPLAVRGNAEILRTIVRDLLVNAVDSLGNTKGTINVGLRPGPRSVSISIEDNGRGLNEEMCAKLEEKGLYSRTARLSVREIRALVSAIGWSFESQARLGVGARSIIELARIDALGMSPRTNAMLRTDSGWQHESAGPK